MTSSGGSATALASRSPRWAGWLALAVLAAQNAWLFLGHYTGALAFPWDFAKTYHAVPFFWTTAVGAGTFPTWIPFQGVGYPLAMNLQSGLFYPPLWIFPALGITYSLHAAAVLQVLHVLFGAFGMSVLARTRGLTWRYALLAGAAYQVFGGFFSNAQHVDIVRGFAWTPWLLATLTVGSDERGFGAPRARALPVVILALLTGAYPGQGVAALALGVLYLLAQLVALDPWPRLAREHLRSVVVRVGLLVLGLLLTAVHLLPAWFHRDQLVRSEEVGSLDLTGLGPWHVFTTLFPYDAGFLDGDVSMRSLFLSVPIVLGLFMVRGRDLSAQSALLVLLLVAAALLQAGRLHGLAIRALPPLGFSRFPAADYRALVAAPAVLLGTLGLRGALEGGLRCWGTLPRALALLAFLWVGFTRWHGHQALSPEATRALCLVLLAVVLVLALGQVRSLGARWGAGAVLLLVLVDGQRQHHALTRPWQAQATPRGARLLSFERMQRELVAELRATRRERPARRDEKTIDGYRRGIYVLYDYAASYHLEGVSRLLAQKPLVRFVKQASAPRLIAAGTPLDPLTGALERPVDGALGSVRSELYRSTELRYAVDARAPALLLENEPAFPGWTAVRSDLGTPLEPAAEAWPLRAWRLPPGNYGVALAFRMPGLRLGAVVSSLAACAWLVLLVVVWRRGRRAVAPRSLGAGALP